jgi:hypothetical protein
MKWSAYSNALYIKAEKVAWGSPPPSTNWLMAVGSIFHEPPLSICHAMAKKFPDTSVGILYLVQLFADFSLYIFRQFLTTILATEHHAKAKHECSTSAMKQDLSIRLHFLIWSLYFQAGMKMRDPTCIRILLYLSSSAYVNLSCHGWENSTFASVSIVFMKTMCFFFS